MDNAQELKQVFNILTAAWRIYRAYYPPKALEDDSYWSELADVIKKTEAEYDSQLYKDVFCNISSDLERKAKLYCRSEKKQKNRLLKQE